MFFRMRTSLLVALACCSAFGAPFPSEICVLPAHAAADQPVSKTVSILGKALELKDTQGGKSGQAFIAEYIPAGETFDNFTVMFASRFTPSSTLDAMVSAQATAKRIQDRQQSDPVANAAVFKAPDNKSVVVDFLMSQGNIFEHNIFRYYKTSKGLVSLQIARRVYDNKTNESEVQEFIKGIKTKRADLLKEIMRTNLPTDANSN